MRAFVGSCRCTDSSRGSRARATRTHIAIRPLQAPTARSRTATSDRSTLAAWRSSVRSDRCTRWLRCAMSRVLPPPLAECRLPCTTARSSHASCTSRSAALNNCGHFACSCRQATTPPRMSCCKTFRASGWHTRSRKESSAKRTRVSGVQAVPERTSTRPATSSRKARAWIAVATSRAMPLARAPSVCKLLASAPGGPLTPRRSGPKTFLNRSRMMVTLASWLCTKARWAFDQVQRHWAPWTTGGGSGGGGHHSSRRRLVRVASAGLEGHVTAMTGVSHNGRRRRLT
mmetsp:Transcript_105110/g.297040  ORF Transcript_105110/g.297040 Transcript_105110/m.297040 type:complete len:287 (-) Transcript_105110:1165-2025(-)